MPVFAYWYYHKACFDPDAFQRPGKEVGEIREIDASEFTGQATCPACSEMLTGDAQEVVA